MKKHALLTFVLGLLLALLILPVVGLLELQIAYASPYTNIDVDTAYDMITNGSYPELVVLDVRYQYEYDDGHIRNAILIPYDELAGRLDELDPEKETLVYCKLGGRSAIASGTLDSNGFTSVYNMEGGIVAWESGGYPVYVHYSSIQTAINNADEGDSVFVASGIYYEHVVANKTISLIGEDRSHTVIDGNGTGNVVVEITAHSVNVTEFTIRNGTKGFSIINSSYNIISGNIVVDNIDGIDFACCPCDPSRQNNITNNIIKNNYIGISIVAYNSNIIYHNSFIDNNIMVWIPGINTLWDNGYPSGGNYWSDHNPSDLYSGPYQNETGSDGIGDTSYIIDGNNKDRYPLIYPYSYVASPDVYDDGVIDIMDVLVVGSAFGSEPGDNNWNPIADLYTDGEIDIMDILIIAVVFGATYP